MGAHASLKVGVPLFDVGAGVEVAVIADVAEIVTNISATPDDEDCKLPLTQEYSIALGATAGASVVVGDATYGPVAAVFTPIWYTTVTGMCASEAETTPAISAPTPTSQAVERRVDLETTVLTTKIRQTGIGCPQSLGPNCALSLRTTTQYTETRSLTTAIPSGEDAEFPTTVHDTVFSVETFGSNVVKMLSSSGSPTSYIPPPPTPTSDSGSSNSGDEKKNDGTRDASCNVALSVTSGLLALVAITAFTL